MAERFTFFWGGPFSQWHASRFALDGVAYACAEQYMMAEKARLFGDLDALDRIMRTSSPRLQQEIGREVKGFVEKIWLQECGPIVYRGNHGKFTQNPRLLGMLLDTEGTTLVEASPRDRFWGIGLKARDPRAMDRSRWRGENRLGETLTLLRGDLIVLRQQGRLQGFAPAAETTSPRTARPMPRGLALPSKHATGQQTRKGTAE